MDVKKPYHAQSTCTKFGQIPSLMDSRADNGTLTCAMACCCGPEGAGEAMSSAAERRTGVRAVVLVVSASDTSVVLTWQRGARGMQEGGGLSVDTIGWRLSMKKGGGNALNGMHA